MDFSVLLQPENLVALATLTALEIVLGIDNIVFISILSGKLPLEQQAKARRLGLIVAMISRLMLVFTLSWVIKLDKPFVEVLGHGISGKDLILLIGGLFLIAKATKEIYEKMEEHHTKEEDAHVPKKISFTSILVQILFLDLVFSIDSVITAVGMVKDVSVMAVSIVVAVGVMLIFAEAISKFIEAHPSLKMVALSFLLTVGVMLLAEGTGQHINKGYIYFAMAFSLFVEMLNIKTGSRGKKKVTTGAG